MCQCFRLEASLFFEHLQPTGSALESLLAGAITQYSVWYFLGRNEFEELFLPFFSPLALLGLLYTIIVMFAYQGHYIILNLRAVFRVFVCTT